MKIKILSILGLCTTFASTVALGQVRVPGSPPVGITKTQIPICPNRISTDLQEVDSVESLLSQLDRGRRVGGQHVDGDDSNQPPDDFWNIPDNPSCQQSIFRGNYYYEFRNLCGECVLSQIDFDDTVAGCHTPEVIDYYPYRYFKSYIADYYREAGEVLCKPLLISENLYHATPESTCNDTCICETPDGERLTFNRDRQDIYFPTSGEGTRYFYDSVLSNPDQDLDLAHQATLIDTDTFSSQTELLKPFCRVEFQTTYAGEYPPRAGD